MRLLLIAAFILSGGIAQANGILGTWKGAVNYWLDENGGKLVAAEVTVSATDQSVSVLARLCDYLCEENIRWRVVRTGEYENRNGELYLNNKKVGTLNNEGLTLDLSRTETHSGFVREVFSLTLQGQQAYLNEHWDEPGLEQKTWGSLSK